VRVAIFLLVGRGSRRDKYPYIASVPEKKKKKRRSDRAVDDQTLIVADPARDHRKLRGDA